MHLALYNEAVVFDQATKLVGCPALSLLRLAAVGPPAPCLRLWGCSVCMLLEPHISGVSWSSSQTHRMAPSSWHHTCQACCSAEPDLAARCLIYCQPRPQLMYGSVQAGVCVRVAAPGRPPQPAARVPARPAATAGPVSSYCCRAPRRHPAWQGVLASSQGWRVSRSRVLGLVLCECAVGLSVLEQTAWQSLCTFLHDEQRMDDTIDSRGRMASK